MSGIERAKDRNGTEDVVLARMLVEAVNERESEFARIAGVLHDEVSQVLSAVGLQLGIMRLDFKDQVPEIEKRTVEIQNILERAIDHLRELSYELNPSIVERAGLQAAMDRLAGRVRKSFPGNFRMYFESGLRVPTPVATAFYKIAEASVDDGIARKCSQIEVQVKRAHSELALEVRTDGEISKLPGDRRSLPVLMMQHHAAQNNVLLEIKTSPEKGTLIRAVHPEPVVRKPEND